MATKKRANHITEGSRVAAISRCLLSRRHDDQAIRLPNEIIALSIVNGHFQTN